MTSARSQISHFLHRLGVGGPSTAGAVATFGVKALGIPSTLLLQLALVRILRPVAYGEFIYAYTWYMTLVPFAALGLHEAAVRFVGQYLSQRTHDALRGFLRYAAAASLIGALVLVALASGTTLLLRAHLTPTLLAALLVAWACLPLGSTAQLASATLRGLGRFAAAQAPLQVLQPLLIVALSAILIVGLGHRATAEGAMVAMAIAVAASSMTVIWLAAWASRPLRLGSIPRYHIRIWNDAAAHFVGLTLILALWRVDVLMMGVLGTTVDVGVYAAAAQLQLVVGFGFYTLDTVLAPRMAGLHAAGERERLQRILRLAARLTAAAAVLGIVVLVSTGRWLLAQFDLAFVAGYPALVVLALGQLFDTLSGSSGRLLTMTGHHRAALWMMTGAVGMNVVLNWLLIPGLGTVGAAAATTIALVAWKTASTAYARRALRIDTTVFGQELPT